MQQFSLNELYSQFINGSIGKTDFEGLIFQYLAGNQAKFNFGHWTQDDYDDFVSWLYPRIRSAIDTYQETGSSFEAYIAAVMRLAARERRMRITARSITEYAAWTVRIPELYAHEDAPVYLQDANEKTENALSQITAIISKRRKNPRQLLILVLKCYCYVSDDFIDRIAPKIGIDRDKLMEMINKLRAIRAERDTEIYLMRERIYSQFYRCIVYEKKLSYLPENSATAAKMKVRLEKARERLARMRKRLAGIRPDATNRQVAQVIGISKGSVDSSLYNLKARWNFLADKSLLN